MNLSLEETDNRSNIFSLLSLVGVSIALVVSIIALVFSIKGFYEDRNINDWKKDFEIKNAEEQRKINEEQRKINEWKRIFLLDYTKDQKKYRSQLKAIRHRDELVQFAGVIKGVSKEHILELWYIKPKDTVTPKNIVVRIYPHLGYKGKVDSVKLDKLKAENAFIRFDYFIWENQKIKINNLSTLLDQNTNIKNFLVSPFYEMRGIAILILYNGGDDVEPQSQLIMIQMEN